MSSGVPVPSSKATPKFAIIADRISAEQRGEINAIVKANANGWWHHFADFWIVGGRTAPEWRDLVGDSVLDGPAGVLVLKLDHSRGEPRWASRANITESGADWLRNNY